MAGGRSNYQIGLQFTADTNQAKKQLQSLQTELMKLGQGNMSSFDKEIQNASEAAMSLAANLRSATNVDTGQLNLTQFNKNLAQSGMTLKDYRIQLSKLGPEGKQQFTNLANSILKAEQPLTKLNGLMGNLWYSFKQTAKYQFTSSIYRGLISGMREAYGYAQDLNASLNDIRIVTGQSTDQMAKFAKAANDAAKALSISTTEYTKGALIYYQQGLDDKTVKARTDVTMKLANASGVSAETASQQLTAIWNNFAKGTDNLEYFADAITALGASTASSTSEIAEGLEKFAGIANSVGLSYEYAAAALATVTATTRQSADVVGTAFKTLFARIQDLEVGEALEDGTTLGKYSQALAAIGVNIKDANGDLKDMDVILDEMGSKWSTLSRDMQVAVAQTVAGTRQYTQMITLMENWDFFKKNVSTAESSEGTLQKQQDIYAESWEAAQKRVKASAQDIYDSLLNDEFFIKLTNDLSKVLDFVADLVDSMGGLKGLLPMLISLFTQLFGPQLVAGLDNVTQKIRDISGITAREYQKTKEEVSKQVRIMQDLPDEVTNQTEFTIQGSSKLVSGNALVQNQKAYNDLQQEYIAKQSTLTDQEKELYKIRLDALAVAGKDIEKQDQEIQKLSEKLEKEQEIAEARKNQLVTTATVGDVVQTNKERIESLSAKQEYGSQKGNAQDKQNIQQIRDIANEIANDDRLTARTRKMAKDLAESNTSFANMNKNAEKLKQQLEEENKILQKNARYTDSIQKKIDKANSLKDKYIGFKEQLGQLKGAGYGSGEGNANDRALSDDELNNLVEGAGNTKPIQDIANAYRDARDAGQDLTDVENKLMKALENRGNQMKQTAATAEKQVQKQMQGTKTLTEEENKAIEENIAEAGQDAETKGRLAGVNRNLGQSSENLGAKFGKENVKIMSASEAFVKLTSVVTSLTFAVNAVSGAVETFGDENATTQQKISAVTSVLMSFGMLIPSISSLLTDLAIKAKAAGMTMAEAAWSSLGPYALVAAGILVLIVAIKGLINLYNKDAKAAEAAAKSAKELASAYDEVKQSYEELKETISDYKEAKDAIEQLQSGTEEFEEAINKANEAARKLIDNFGANYIYNAATGIIEIADEELERIEKLQKAGLDSAQLGAITAQQAANTTKTQSERTKLLRNDDQSFLGHAGDVLGHMFGQAGIGAVAGVGVGTVPGAIIGAVSGLITGIYKEVTETTKANENQSKQLKELEDTYIKSGGNFEAAIDKVDGSLISALGGTDSVKSYLEGMYQNQLENIQLTKQLVASQHSDYIDENVADDLVDAFTTVSAKQVEEEKKRLLNNKDELYASDRIESGWLGGKTRISDMADFRKRNYLYVEAMNAKGEAQYRVGGNGRFVEKLNSEGQWEELKNLSEDVQDSTIAEYKALQAVQGEFSNINNTLEADVGILTKGLKIDREKAIGLINNELNGKGIQLGNLTSSEVSRLNNFTDENGYENIVALGKASGVLSDTSTQEDIQAYIDRALKAIESYNTLTKKINKNLSQSGQILYDSLVTGKDFTLNEKNKISSFISESFKSGGSQGIGLIQKLMTQTNDPLGFIDAFNSVDWKEASFEDIQKSFKKFNIGTEALRNYYVYQKEIVKYNNFLQNGLDALLEDFKKLREITSKIEVGSVISTEDYNKIINELPEEEAIKDNFVRTPEGWMFIGDPDELRSKINGGKVNGHDYYVQARKDQASAKQGIYSNQNLYERVGLYSEGGYDEGDTSSSYGFNKTAAAKAGIADDEHLRQLIVESLTADTEEAKKAAYNTLQLYYDALGEVAESEDFSEFSEISSTLLADFINPEEFQTAFNKKVEELGLNINDEKVQELYHKLFKANILNSDEIDTSQLEHYTDVVKRLNPELNDLSDDSEEVLTSAHAYGVLVESLNTNGINVNQWEELYNWLLRITNLGVEEAQAAAEHYLELKKSLEDQFLNTTGLDEFHKKLNRAGFSESERDVLEETRTRGQTAAEDLGLSISKYQEIFDDLVLKQGKSAAQADKIATNFVEQLEKITEAGYDTNKWGEKYNELLKEYNYDIEKAAKGAESYAKQLKQINDLGLNEEEWKEYVETQKRLYPDLANNEEKIRQIAIENARAAKGLKELKSNYESWTHTLKTAEKTNTLDSTDAVLAVSGFQKAMAQIMGLAVEDLDQLKYNFILTNAELIETAMSGDEAAMQELIANSMIAQQIITTEQKEDYILLQQWIAEHPFATDLQIRAYLKSVDSSLANIIDTDQWKKMITGAGASWTGFGWSARDLNVAGLSEDDKSKSGKNKTPKLLEDEIDRYHRIKKLLADIERELERVNKVKERAYGAQHLKYLEQEIGYLQEEVGLQEQYISEIEGYLGKDRGLMAAYGATFDAAGNISNYDEIFAANFNKYANAEDSTNWENFKKALSQYEDTLQLWFDETEKKADLLREILDKRLEGISYKVEVGVALDDREIALLEHQLKRLDDAAYDTAAALANIGAQFEQTEEKIDKTTQGIIDVLETIPGITQDRIDRYMAGDGSALDGLTVEQGQIDLLEQYTDDLLELSDTLKELHDDALQRVLDAFDAWDEKIENHIAKFEHLNNILNNYQEIIGLVGRGNLGIDNEFIRAMREQQITNLQGILSTRTQAKDALAAQLADAREKAAAAATDAEREDWEKVVDDLENRLKEATESWQQAWIAALEANKDAFDQTMQELVDSFKSYEDELKRYDTAQDRYLETYRQAYELSKLTRDIESSINDQDSIRAKKELQKLEDKITDIKKSGRKISEDELELLQKEYELRLAEIALEDARNAKSMVRLSRDNEGNWGYVYTADQDAIEKAEQDYEDKLYAYMRQADTMAEQASRSILTLNREMAEALAALDVTSEDYEQQVAEITAFYADQLKYYEEQYGISVDAIETVAYESARTRMPEIAEIIKGSDSGLQTSWGETVTAIIGGAQDLETAITRAETGIQTALGTTTTAYQQYKDKIALIFGEAGVDITQFKEHMDTEFGKIQTSSGELEQTTEELIGDLKGYVGGVLDEFEDFTRKYSDKVAAIDLINQGLATSIITLEETLQGLDGEQLTGLAKLTDKVGQIAQQIREVANDVGASTDAIDDALNKLAGLDFEREKTKVEGEYYDPRFGETGQAWRSRTMYDRSVTQKQDLPKKILGLEFASGGYTGNWGMEGRLAILHEKELVLNADDTKNMLDAVSILRQITAGTAQLSSGLGNIGARLANFISPSGSLDQNVNIQASFPNVTNHNEIEEALTNLVNKASQYAFRPVYT